MSENESKKKRRKLSTLPYRGVRDFYPEHQSILSYLFGTLRGVVERFGYVEYSASVLEPAELYKAKGAENEEIVREQTYTFLDRGRREVTLRPEMTPTAARMVAARKRELGFPLRWYSLPNLFRYERPQRGRLREHYQLNVDLFGVDTHVAEVEVIAVAHAIMKAFKATDTDFTIRLGSRRALDLLFDRHALSLPERKAMRLLIDRKAKITDFDAQAHKIMGRDFAFSHNEPSSVRVVCEALAKLGISNAQYDPTLTRGFDYYTDLVFEVFDTHPKNNRALFGGGRYDNLLELFGNERIPAVGFGMGDVSMLNFLEVRGLLPPYTPATKLYLGTVGEEMIPFAMKLAGELRGQGVAVAVNLTDRRAGDQIKVADKHAIPFILFVGEKELEGGVFVVRELATGKETTLGRKELDNFFLRLSA